MTDPALRDYDRDFDAAMERHFFPDECACADPVPVSACCGEPLDGLRCAQCHDNATAECAACERGVGQ